MGLLKSNHLIRTLLIVFCFQFTVASFLSVEAVNGSAHNSFASHKLAKPLTLLSSLFEKTEKDEREKDFVAEVQEFAPYNFNRFTPVQTILRTDIISYHIQKPPLFELHCVFLI